MYKKEFNGTGEKALLILSGIHGNEYEAIRLVSSIERILPDNIPYSRITILGCVNEYGIKNNVRQFNPVTDLNRIFKDDELVQKLKQEIINHDFIIDCHSSPNCMSFALVNNDCLAKCFVEFFDKYNVEYAVYNGSNSTIKSFCNKIGTPAITYEISGVGNVALNDLSYSMSGLNTIIDNFHKMVLFEDLYEGKILKELKCQYDGILFGYSNDSYSIINIETGEINSVSFKIGRKITDFINGYYKEGDTLLLYEE